MGDQQAYFRRTPPPALQAGAKARANNGQYTILTHIANEEWLQLTSPPQKRCFDLYRPLTCLAFRPRSQLREGTSIQVRS